MPPGFSPDETEYFRRLSEFKYEMDMQSKVKHARLEGEMRGEKRGEKRGVEATARNALAEGASPEFVQKITGLDTETIARLQAGG